MPGCSTDYSRQIRSQMNIKPIVTIAQFTLLEAIRNRLSWMLAGSIVLCLLLAEFAGTLALTETAAIKSSAYGAIMRIVVVFMIGLFVTISLQRESTDKHILMYLSLPLKRSVYLFGKLAGYLLLACAVSFMIAIPTLLYADAGNAAAWGLALAFELFIIIALCVLCSLTFANATLGFSIAMAFYVLARSMGDIVLLSQSPILQTGELSMQFMQTLIQWIALLLPDLWNFAGSDRLVHEGGDFLPVLVQTVIYVSLLTAAALFDLYRKNF